ncbi:uncharacterized protein LOC133195835 isoform X2 [Saccostrea echinata]|nr:uncharacterized protein LOC133195835 isoform X2 [Saccostrea echinata]
MSTPSVGNGPDEVKPNPGSGVIVDQPDNIEYEQSLQIVLGTVCGVVGLLGLIIIISLLYKLYKRRNSPRRSPGKYIIISLLYKLYKRRNSPCRSPDHPEEELSSSISIDLDQKQIPTILLLYAYDCVAHEKVVSALAGFLIDTCNCNVHLDIFEDQIIHERGLDDWLVDRLQEADFIIVLCSVGARLRCTKKRVRFKCDPYRTIPDYFAVAVDYVAEKMRVERMKGLPMSRFIVAYMDYSYSSDIPHQIEMGTKFHLMKDITKLFCHVHGMNNTDSSKFGNLHLSMIDKYYESSENGLELQVAIESAKEFFKCNPNWVEDSMEVLPPPTTKSKSRPVRKRSLEPLLGEPPNDPRMVDTKVDVHRQNFSSPQPSEQDQIFSSPKTLSRQTDSFKMKNRYSADIETIPCILCGQVDHYSDNCTCKGREQRKNAHDNLNDDEDSEFFSVRVKSRSMPTMCSTSLHSSQTVFQVDVHKEWTMNEGHMSDEAESQEYESSRDLDDLERDLQSIISPMSTQTKTMSLPIHGMYGQQMQVLPEVSKFPVTQQSSSSSSMGSLQELCL